MSETAPEDTVRVVGTETFDQIDCERFRVDGTATVHGVLRTDDATINGNASVGGSLDAGEVTADGSLTVDGDGHARAATIDGAGTFGGRLAVDLLRVDGSVTVEADASADHVAVDGSATVGGNLDGHEVECDGTLSVEGTVVAAELAVDGRVAVDELTDVADLSVDGTATYGDVNAERVTTDGRLDAGEVSAQQFELTLHADSAAEAVDATEVAVRRGESGDGLLGGGGGTLEVGVVTGETIELDATRAETVAGERVTLGPDVEVAVVYADDLSADDAATVGEVRASDEY